VSHIFNLISFHFSAVPFGMEEIP